MREAYLATEGKVPIVADGGVKDDKDVFLAIACGASTVMLGSLLSGTDEAPGLVVEDPATRQKMKLYRGMTSPEAVVEGAEEDDLAEALRTPAEGQSVRVPYVGSVVGILGRIRGHLQSAVSYAGEGGLRSAHLKVARDPGEYLIPLSNASRRESFGGSADTASGAFPEALDGGGHARVMGVRDHRRTAGQKCRCRRGG